MITQLLAISVGTLVSEDLACIAAGVLVAQQKLSFLAASLACFAGIFVGDAGLFLAGRLVGMPALKWRMLRRLAPGAIQRTSEWFERRGGFVILISRFSPGLRLPTYFASGLTRARAAPLLLWFAGAAGIWTPLLVGASAIFGAAVLRSVLTRLPLLAVAAGMLLAANKARDRVFRRRVQAFFCRKIRWEFWPAWAAYLPLLPYLLFLACKYRSATLFTSANPGIPSGGLLGESKWDILTELQRAGNYVAQSKLLQPGGFSSSAFPIVLKPNVGERGRGVAIVRSEQDLHRYIAAARDEIIVQEYVTGIEFGVFYIRYPDEERGHIVSITEKRLPGITGDGHSTVLELILNDARAFCIADTYLRNIGRDPAAVPREGERIPLAEIGSHCRGAIFVNASHLKTEAIESAIDSISKAHPGFYFGRFDLRAESVEAFQQGRGFKVLELNGVGAEATHIYDPTVGIREAYRVMRAQWRMAFEIGAINRSRGVRVLGAVALLKLAWLHRREQAPRRKQPSPPQSAAQSAT